MSNQANDTTIQPALMGPHITGPIGEEFRQRFGTDWVSFPELPGYYFLGNDRITITSPCDGDYVYAERSLEDVKRIMALPLSERVGDNAFWWDSLAHDDGQFEYPFLLLESALKEHGIW